MRHTHSGLFSQLARLPNKNIPTIIRRSERSIRSEGNGHFAQLPIDERLTPKIPLTVAFFYRSENPT